MTGLIKGVEWLELLDITEEITEGITLEERETISIEKSVRFLLGVP
jgi:hypothetical protein